MYDNDDVRPYQADAGRDRIEAADADGMQEDAAGETSAGSLAARIDAAIDAGIRQGRAAAERGRIRARRRRGGAAAACLILLACVFTIRVSPVFAALVRDIPGFEKFVDLIRSTQDQGIGLALDNDFVLPVGASDEHDGMKLTVQGIIADDSRMVLFYEIQLPDKDHDVQLGKAVLTDVSGRSLPAGISYAYSEEAKQEAAKAGVQRGTMDINLEGDHTFPDEMIWKMTRTDLLDPNGQPVGRPGTEGASGANRSFGDGVDFQVRFRIDREKFAGLRQEYALHQTIDVEGQKITFAKAVVSPLRVSLYLDYDKANDKQIFGPGDIRLIDEHGTAWKQYMGNLEKDNQVYHFESPYFNEPKSLFIEGSWFRALARDKMQATVDVDRGLVLQAPDGKLALHGATQAGDKLKLDFELRRMSDEDKMMYSLFEREFRDADGRSYRMVDREGVTGSFEPGEHNLQHVYYYIDNLPYKQPLTFTIYNYPQYIRQPYSIRIK